METSFSLLSLLKEIKELIPVHINIEARRKYLTAWLCKGESKQTQETKDETQKLSLEIKQILNHKGNHLLKSKQERVLNILSAFLKEKQSSAPSHWKLMWPIL